MEIPSAGSQHGSLQKWMAPGDKEIEKHAERKHVLGRVSGFKMVANKHKL